MVKKILLLLLSGVFLFACARFSPQGEYQGPAELSTPFHGTSDLSTSFHPTGPFQLSWPVEKVKLSQKYRPSSNPDHDGIDLTHYSGAPILAAHDGYVIYKGSQYRGYGRMVIIEYNKKWATLYAHLKTISVKEGQVVKAGQKIGTMGRTGRATGTHLHFEVLKEKLPVNPLDYLGHSQNIVKHE